MARIYTITQEKLDAVKPEDRRVIFPGVTGPGEYTYSEADNLYRPVAHQVETELANRGEAGFMGIGGIGIYAENEAPIIPSVAALAREERLSATDTICRRCGASKNFGGAMFTTMAGGDICDDCF